MTTATRKPRPLRRIGYALRASTAFAKEPYEALERTREKLSERRDERHGTTARSDLCERAEERAHEMIGAAWPCDEIHAFDEVWHETLGDLAALELRIGRGAFGGWDDGDPRLVRLAWCMTRHLRPRRVLETGVGRGLTTRVVLEALHRNGEGELWSIDLPPLLEHELHSETAAAVPDRLRYRWTLTYGSSRRVLPGLVRELGAIDLFVHDSMHTTRNVHFELDAVWPALADGAPVLIDDVEKNRAMDGFLNKNAGTPSMVFTSEDEQVLIGCLVKRAART